MIVLCYSSIDTNSFHEAETVIWPELNERYPDVPIILVATKCDARPDEELWSMDEGKSFIGSYNFSKIVQNLTYF